MKTFDNRLKLSLAIVVACAIIIWLMTCYWSWLPWPQCPFHRYLGLNCPMCGSTRAWLAVFHGHWQEAFQLNPIFWLWGFWGGVLLSDLGLHVFQQTHPTWGERWIQIVCHTRLLRVLHEALILATMVYLNHSSIVKFYAANK